jgi:deazaflavin-dependent oxidoreductase (nitroreductase family)
MKRLAAWIGDKPWFRPIATEVVPRVDRALAGLGWRATPWPTLLLTTTRRSGHPHSTPLYFVDHGNTLAIIASNYGRAEPVWSHNLRRASDCVIKLHRRDEERTARLATDQEWESLFTAFAAFYPAYVAYRQRAGRHIPIWVLEPHSSRT